MTEKVNRELAGIPVIGKRLVGPVDNSAYPAINVAIEMTLVTPAEAKGPVPVLMMFGFGELPGDPPPARPMARREQQAERLGLHLCGSRIRRRTSN